MMVGRWLDYFGFALFVLLPFFVTWRWFRRFKDQDRLDPEICENCGYDLRATPKRCPECGAAGSGERFQRLKRLREDWPTETFVERVPGDGEQPKVIYESDDYLLIDLVRQHIQARGIRCQLIEPVAMGEIGAARTFGTWKLIVWTEDVDRAKAIVEHLMPAAS